MSISLTSFAIGACAVWRIAHIIASEDGPGEVLFLIRQRLGQGFAARLIDCFDCVSMWVSAPSLFIHASWTERIVIWMGISGAACLLERISERRAADAGDLGGMKHAMLWREESSTEESSEDSASL